MIILTDGKNYVMENPMKKGVYISTTSPIQAKEFTFKQAKAVLNNRSKKMAWIKCYYMVDKEIDKKPKISLKQKGNGGVYIGTNDISFDEANIDLISW